MKLRGTILLACLAVACGEEAGETVEPTGGGARAKPEPKLEPTKVAFDHVMIAFRGSKNSTARRSRDEARRLAEQVYDAAKAGTDWLALKDEYTDDRTSRGVPLGPYVLANLDVPYDVQRGEIPRSAYSKDLADRLFAMRVGEIALVPYHKTRCPFGFHVLTRLQ